MTSSLILFAGFVVSLALVAFIIYLVVKQVQFIVLSIPLYKEMVSNQSSIVKAIKETNDEIRSLHHSIASKSNGELKPAALKEIKL